MADDILFNGTYEEEHAAPTREEVKLYIMSKMNVSQEAVNTAIEAVGIDMIKVEEYLKQKG